MVVSSLLEVEKLLELWTNTLIQTHQEGYCSKVHSPLLLATHSPACSPTLGGGIVQAPWLVSASRGGALSLALYQAARKRSRRGREGCKSKTDALWRGAPFGTPATASILALLQRKVPCVLGLDLQTPWVPVVKNSTASTRTLLVSLLGA